MMFLLSDKLDEIKGQTSHDADNYGPYSEIMDEESAYLEDIGAFVTTPGEIELTREGKEIANIFESEESEQIIHLLSEYKKFLNDMNANEILSYVYSAYPDMNTNEILSYVYSAYPDMNTNEILSYVYSAYPDMNTNEILSYVYSAYPDMTNEPIAYDKLKPSIENHTLSLVNKKKISSERVSELLNKPHNYIIKK